MIINHIADKPQKLAPSDVISKLKAYNKNLELLWNEDENRYEFYLQQGENLIWQISSPIFGEVTPGIVDWLKKYDTSHGGRLDTEDRQKRWRELFNYVIRRNDMIKEKRINDALYEVKHRCKWLDRYRQNQRQAVVPRTTGPLVEPALIVGEINGKKIRAYKKRGPKIDANLGKGALIGT